MGAISSSSSTHVLREFLDDKEQPVRETCEIALAKIEWDHSEEARKHAETSSSTSQMCVHHFHSYDSPIYCWKLLDRAYTSIDPAPPSSGLMSGRPRPTGIDVNDVLALKTTLLDTTKPLFERYRSMFALRNLGTPEAVDALASGFVDDSALFKCAISPNCFK